MTLSDAVIQKKIAERVELTRRNVKRATIRKEGAYLIVNGERFQSAPWLPNPRRRIRDALVRYAKGEKQTVISKQNGCSWMTFKKIAVAFGLKRSHGGFRLWKSSKKEVE